MCSTRLRMNERTLYIDASVDTKSKTGFGAHLLIDRSASTTEYQNGIEVKQFDFTSSTKLELQNLLWAFSQIRVSGGSLVVYTDSQNLIQLPVRRSALEQKKFNDAFDQTDSSESEDDTSGQRYQSCNLFDCCVM